MPRAPPTVAYDAERAPEKAAWLAADEVDRLAAVEAYHRALAAPHPATPKPRVHAAFHLVVETQLASGDPPQAGAALARLVAAGATRHEAIHAIGSVVAEATRRALSGAAFDPAAYARELDALTLESWRSAARGG